MPPPEPDKPASGPSSAVPPAPEVGAPCAAPAPLPETIAREMDELRARAAEADALRQKAGERDEFLALAQRVQADFANYQKRSAEEKEKWTKFLAGELLRDLLPAVDAFDASASAVARGGDPKAHLQGFQIAVKELVRVLEKNGLKAIAPTDGEFDPSLHEAVGLLETPDQAENRVGELMRKGYRLHERVLRPAQVRVTRRPAPPAGEAGGGSP